MSYTASITITVPAALYSVACAGAVLTTGEPDQTKTQK